ncbi:TRAP transporter small permease [Arthrobacter sulfonylureivorans]|uniref:TRAP transporter small permease n=1 Tax=Arthrobacter sulfonylureivorans TaxID=2486855 RepID=UPI0039E3B733
MLSLLWSRAVRPAAKILGLAAAVLCGGLALLVTAEVVLRGATGESIRGLFEIAELGLVMVVFLGFSQAEVNATHVRVTLLTDRLTSAVANRLRGISLLLCAVFLAWMGWELVQRAIESFETGEFRTGLLSFPIWPSRSFIALGVSFLAIVMLVKGLTTTRGRELPEASTKEGAASHVG